MPLADVALMLTGCARIEMSACRQSCYGLAVLRPRTAVGLFMDMESVGPRRESVQCRGQYEPTRSVLQRHRADGLADPLVRDEVHLHHGLFRGNGCCICR